MVLRRIARFTKLTLLLIRVLYRTAEVALSKGSDTSVLLLSPGPRGSTGDQALLEATGKQLRSAGYTQILYISYGENIAIDNAYSDVEIIPLSKHLSSRKLTSPAYWKERLKLLVLIKKVRLCVVLGADVLDGHYSSDGSIARLRFVSLTCKLGRRSCVISCSFSNNAPIEIKRFIARKCKAVEFFLRDPISFDRFLDIHEGKSKLTADCAFLVDACESANVWRSRARIRQARSQGNFVFGVNISAASLEWGNGIVDRRLGALVNEWRALFVMVPKMLLVLIPHDIRGGILKDQALLQRFKAGVMDSGIDGERLLEIDEGLPFSEIKVIVGELDACFSCRMHLAIACLGSCTPVLCLSYNDKFEGLFDHFALHETIVETSMLESGNKLSKKLQSFMVSAPQQRAQIKDRLPAIIDLARRNYSFLG